METVFAPQSWPLSGVQGTLAKKQRENSGDAMVKDS